VIGPVVGGDLDVVAASMIAAVNQDIANAGGAHFGEGDFDGAGVMVPVI